MSKYIPVDPEKWAEMVKAMAENRLLKAEVERLQNNCDYLDRELDREIDKTAMLCGQVERLRKAGDAMEIALQADFNGCPYEPLVIMQAIRRWRTAKRGKQP